MQQLILVLHVLVALAIIILVLLQYGKGADMGASFGSGGSQTMFGSQGPMPFLMKLTAILAFIFFVTSLSLSYFSGRPQKQNNLFDVPPPAPITAPVNSSKEFVPEQPNNSLDLNKSKPEKKQ